jgi:hypothetical protein
MAHAVFREGNRSEGQRRLLPLDGCASRTVLLFWPFNRKPPKMKKSEVEMILLSRKYAGREHFLIKIYRDGTLIRQGSAGTPPLAVGGMTVQGSQQYWDHLIARLDDRLVEEPVWYVDPRATIPVETVMAFYGASSNGDTNERAQWTKTSGTRFLIDQHSDYRHAVLDLIESFALDAAEATNSWFFDVVVTAIYDFRPVGLTNTFVTGLPDHAGKRAALDQYINYIGSSPHDWDLVEIGHGRSYRTPSGKLVRSVVENTRRGTRIRFEREHSWKNAWGLLK